MSWFLVLLFWNPAVQDFEVADGWAPLPQPTYAQCDLRMQYVQQYLPSYTENLEYMVDCIKAKNPQAAIDILKEQ